MIDGHHTMAAALELGIEVTFDIAADSEELTGEELLDARYIDSAYYDIVTGVDVW